MGRGLDVIDADDEEGVVIEEADVGVGDIAFELGDGAGADDGGVEAEAVPELGLPLRAEIGRAEDAEACDFATAEELASDEEGLDGFADADVVGDEHADGIQAEGHHHGDELIRARADAELAEGAERAGAVAEGEAGGVEEELDAGVIAGAGGVRWREGSECDGIEVEVVEGLVDAEDFVF